MLYAALRALLRHALGLYFRRIEIEGRTEVPATGPLLLAANHPHTLIDALLVGACIERRVGFVAKATVFRGLAGRLLRALGAVPVERAIDGAVDEAARERNRRALAACEEAVAAGGALLIFPEGISQEAPRLQPLKTGLARIALGAEARVPGQVVVVPVALVYDDRETFRSRARVSFGSAIRVEPFARARRSDPDDFTSVRALTETVRDALETHVVHVAEVDNEPLVAELDALYGRSVESDAGGRLAATAAIARAVNSFAQEDPERVQRVRESLAHYRRGLAEAGVDDAVVRAETRAPSLEQQLAYLAALPVALWGIVNHAAYYQLPRAAVRLFGTERLYASAVKLGVGIVSLIACYALQTAVAWRLGGPLAGTLYLVTLPVSGLVALGWLEARAARQRSRRRRHRLEGLGADRLRQLREERRQLVRELDRARVAYLGRALAAEPGAPAIEPPF
jgi:1-acyl-sn-glycerol-3-phosphate acyltransferase